MQAERHLQLLGGRPEGIVIFGIKREILGRRGPNQRARQTLLGRIGQIPSGLLRIVERDQRQALEPLGGVRAKFRKPIVVDLKASSLKSRVADPKHAKAQGGVEHVAGDAVQVHVFHSLRRVPTAAMRASVGKAFEELLQLLERFVGAEA